MVSACEIEFSTNLNPTKAAISEFAYELEWTVPKGAKQIQRCYVQYRPIILEHHSLFVPHSPTKSTEILLKFRVFGELGKKKRSRERDTSNPEKLF